MYPVGQRGPDPAGAGDHQGYRADPEADADAEGERKTLALSESRVH